MGVFELANILVALFACQPNRIHLRQDWTDSLNAVVAGNLSIKALSRDLNHYPSCGNSSTHIYGLYVPDCKIIAECGNEINDVVTLLHKTQELMTPKREIILQLKFRLDIKTLSLNLEMNQTKLRLPTGKFWAYMTLPDKTSCDDLENVTEKHWVTLLNASSWLSFDPVHTTIGMGFGYNENLLFCYKFSPVVQNSTFFLTSLNLQNTSGVMESFSLFNKRMEYLHIRNTWFLSRFVQPKFVHSFIDYHVSQQNFEDKDTLRRLKSYWQRYVPPTVPYYGSSVGAFTPFPLKPTVELKQPELISNQVVPYINADSCHQRKDIPWFAPAALDKLSRHFKAAVLTHVEWGYLTSGWIENYYAAYQRGLVNKKIRLDIIIDYTNWLQDSDESSKCRYNWNTIETEISASNKISAHYLENVTLKTMLFLVTNKTGNIATIVNSQFAKRMSSRVKIGCGFRPNSFRLLPNTTATAVVTACQQINGSVYSLQSEFELNSDFTVEWKNIQHFSIKIPADLREMKRFRRDILILHPQATVYFQLRIKRLMSDYHASVVCNAEALSLNEYVEAIMNWAALYEIPLIMGRAFDDSYQSPDHTWFSVLRPSSKHLTQFNPYIVSRNYPKQFQYQDLESCIEWTDKRPAISESYFHNKYIGSVFLASYIQKNKTVSHLEYQKLLQFILHRFDVVEIELDSDSFKDCIEAINIMAVGGMVGPQKKFLINFTPSEATDAAKFKIFKTFLQFTKETLATNLVYLKGISFLWGAFQVPNNNKEQDLNATIRRNNMLLGWGRSFNYNMGVAMYTFVCQDLILYSVLHNKDLNEIGNLLSAAGFIVCIDIVDVNMFNHVAIGALFDKHLYLKNLMQDFYPRLDFHIRVSVQVSITETTIHKYLVLLSNFQTFASKYNLSYTIINAFDLDGNLPNGWWKISNYSNLALSSVYEEKYSALVGSETWRPPVKSKTSTKNENDTNLIFVVAVFVMGFVLLVVAFMIVVWYCKNKGKVYLSNEAENEFRNGRNANGEELALTELDLFSFLPINCPYNEELEIAKDKFRFDDAVQIGSGNFGCVYKMEMNEFETAVAVKVPKLSEGKNAVLGALREIKILAFIGSHENVIRILGACTKELRKGIVYIGSLLNYLQTSKDEKPENQFSSSSSEIEKRSINATQIGQYEMLRFATEIAKGMDFISKKNVVHADLAARNVLLDHNRTVKIGDFGLSKKLYNYQNYVKKDKNPLPWRWMAFETLKKMEFSTMSDVWSYGITVWEIFTLGDVPYPTEVWDDDFLLKLESGLHPIKPIRSSDEGYNLMKNCWNITPNLRPTFAQLSEDFLSLKNDAYQQVV